MVSVAPGGIYTDLLFWLKGDAGVTTGTGVNKVIDWDDQSLNGYDFTQGDKAEQPDLVAEAINFNPVINFDGQNDRLEDQDAEDYLNGNQAISSFVAVLTNNLNTDDAIFTTADDSTNTDAPNTCLLYTSPSPRDRTRSRMPSSA